MQMFDCDDNGPIKEYIGCKIDYNLDERWLKFTQPVMVQSFQDEFDLSKEASKPTTPAETG